ncbi:APC family permease [Kitasatospora sp. NPDC004799]|uniref:APC family permease n=1 Tax=Kitasatospora sp. NPDC004799 TaxID=3154460 RepID=UPI0033B2CC98
MAPGAPQGAPVSGISGGVPVDQGTAGGAGDKGLRGGSVGLLSSVVLGVSTVAPVYCLTATLGPTVTAVGVQMPAVFLAGFLPMLLVAFAYKELNKDFPDCGTSFTWGVRAFGPRVGWMAGWGLTVATIIVLSNLAGVATDFLYLMLGEMTGSGWVTELDQNKAVHLLTVVLLIAGATAMSYRGMTATKWFQYSLVGLQLAVLLLFSVIAVGKAASGDLPDSIGFSLSWLNPLEVDSFSAFTAGLSLSIFMYWGWDTCLTMNEETQGSAKTPGRAAMISMVTLVGSYLLVAIASQMFAGVGSTGNGLGNPATADNVFAALARPVLGSPWSILLFLAVVASAAASLQTTFIPVARTLLAMSAYRAVPPRFGTVHPRFRTPGYATVAAGIATAVFYVGMSLISENVVQDTILALGLMICFYYALTAFACVWYFRRSLRTGARELLLKGVAPLLGGVLLSAVFLQTLTDAWAPDYGSGSVFGIGSVFVIGVGILLLGAGLMTWYGFVRPEFFRGETLRKDTQALVVED